MEIVAHRLRNDQIEAPLAAEREPVYTARCLLQPIRTVLGELNIRGLVDAGEGSARVRPAVLFGLRFYPDLAVTYHGTRTLAFEVKFLRLGGRENATATALGQAYLYKQAGYRQCGVLLVDMTGQVTDREIRQAEDVCRSAQIELIVRRKSGLFLGKHPG